MSRSTLPGHAAEPSLRYQPVVDRIVSEMGPGFTQLARRLRRSGPAAEGSVVLLTGCRRSVGCTTAALALARAAAAEQAVLLVDADLAHRGLSTQIDPSSSWGWDDALRGICLLEDAQFMPDITSPFTLLPLRGSAVDATELATNPAFADWQAQFRRTYDLIVLDGGSVWDAGAAWTAWADVALIVCDSGNKLAEDWARAWDKLEEGGSHILGIIETLG